MAYEAKGEDVAERIKYIKNKEKKEKYFLSTLSVVGVVGFLAIWQILAQVNIISSRYVSTPIDIFKLFFVKLYDPRPEGAVLGVHVLASLEVALLGFGAAIAIGIPLGLFMGWYKSIDSFTRPIFEILRPIPPVSWIPLVIVWMGIGLKAKALIVFFSAFVPCVINSYTGIKETNPTLINFAKTCGASNFTIFRRIGIPSALPLAFAGIRIALGNAWATLVAAEMLASFAGLGYMILMGRQFARPDLVILGIIVIGAIGAILISALEIIENKIFRWKKQ